MICQFSLILNRTIHQAPRVGVGMFISMGRWYDDRGQAFEVGLIFFRFRQEGFVVCWVILTINSHVEKRALIQIVADGKYINSSVGRLLLAIVL